MPDDTGAPWLATAHELLGVAEFPGGADNPAIMGWSRFIELRYPEMEGYDAGRDETAWCGRFVGYCLAKHGIKPPFGATDVQRYLWAKSYAPPGYGFRLAQFRRGCIVVFDGDGLRHVAFGLEDLGDRIRCVGGNQSNAVTEATFPTSAVIAYVWPNALAAAPAELRTPADVRLRMAARITLAEARRDAQGRLAVYALPVNDGGGTYEVAGINERWHPEIAAKLKALIESGRYAEAENAVAEYTASYTDYVDLWTSRWALEFYLRDTGFHRGPTGVAKILQRALKLRGEDIGKSGPHGDGVDGEVGPLTIAALRRQESDVEAMLAALRQAREDYEREDVGYRANFWNGLINRFNNQLTVARRFDAEQPKESIPMPDNPSPQPTPKPPDTATMGIDQQRLSEVMNVALAVIMVMQMMKGGQVQLPGNLLPPAQPQPQPTVQQPAPAASAPAAQPANLISILLGLLGVGGVGLGQITGTMPAIGPEATGAGPSVLLGSLLSMAFGALGAASPTLGLIGRVIRGGVAAAQQPK